MCSSINNSTGDDYMTLEVFETIHRCSRPETLQLIRDGDLLKKESGGLIHVAWKDDTRRSDFTRSKNDYLEKVTQDESERLKITNEKEAQRKEEVRAHIEQAKSTGDWSDMPPHIVNELAADVILTTSMFVANHEIEQELDVITAECAYGMNIFRDLFAGVRDIVGGRSKATEKVLQDARDAAMSELRRKAATLGADAVIAIHLEYVELSGGGKNGILLVVATGTAVSLKD